MRIQINVHKTGEGADGIAKQVAYATALTMNRTLDEAQAAERRGIDERFTLRPRSRTFVQRLVKRRLDDFAKPTSLTARLRIEGPENEESKAQLLTRHEEGGTRTPPGGGYSIDTNYQVKGMFYLPTNIIRPSFGSEVPRRLYPANLRLVERVDIVGKLGSRSRITRGGNANDVLSGRSRIQIQGKERTFVLTSPKTGKPVGIFQRHDGKAGKSERTDIVMIWSFQRSVTTRPRLQFFDTVERTVSERYDVNFKGFIQFAARTAK